MLTKQQSAVVRPLMMVRIEAGVEDTVRMFAAASGRSIQTEVNWALAEYYAPFQKWKALQVQEKTES